MHHNSQRDNLRNSHDCSKPLLRKQQGSRCPFKIFDFVKRTGFLFTGFLELLDGLKCCEYPVTSNKQVTHKQQILIEGNAQTSTFVKGKARFSGSFRTHTEMKRWNPPPKRCGEHLFKCYMYERCFSEWESISFLCSNFIDCIHEFLYVQMSIDFFG